MGRTVVETKRVVLIGGIDLVYQTVNYEAWDGKPASYNTHDLDGLDSNGVVALSELAHLLQNLPDLDELEGFDLEDFLKDYARDLAEDEELPFTFTDVDGRSQTYTPQSLWESSGGCEWEESAQEGYDYGWNI